MKRRGKSINRQYSSLAILKYVVLSYPWTTLAAVLAGVAAVGGGVGLMACGGYLLTKAATWPRFAALSLAITGARFCGLSRGAFRYLERLSTHEVTFKLLKRFRVGFYQAIEPAAPSCFARLNRADLLDRLVADIESLEHLFARIISPLTTAIIVPLLFGFFIGFFSPVAMIGFWIITISTGILTTTLHHRRRARTIWRLGARQTLIREQIVKMVDGQAELALYGQLEPLKEQLAKLEEQNGRERRMLARFNGLDFAFLAFGQIAAIVWLLLIFAATQVFHESNVDFSYLTALALGAFAAFEVIPPLLLAFQRYPLTKRALKRALAFGSEWLNDSDSPPSPPVKNNEVRKVDIPPTIQFQKIGLVYPGRARSVLSDFSMTIKPGERVAIVGPSGAGKTSILKALCRLEENWTGDVCLDGKSVRNLSHENLSEIMAVVPQDVALFNGTIRDNLTLGDDSIDDQRLWAALTSARLEDWACRAPMKLDTIVGEYGLSLSGGERRRLGIARALARKSPVLVLDEPWADLDLATAAEIQRDLIRANDRTIILITHVYQNLAAMDRILVLRDGCLVESGDWSQLTKNDSLFNALIEAH